MTGIDHGWGVVVIPGHASFVGVYGLWVMSSAQDGHLCRMVGGSLSSVWDGRLGANHKNSKSKKKVTTATSSQPPPLPSAPAVSLDSSTKPANTKSDPVDPFSTATKIYTTSCNRALIPHDHILTLHTLWDTTLEVGRKIALGGLEGIKEDVLAEGMELGKVLGRREEMENYRGDMETSYKWGFMVGQEVGAHEEGE